MTDTENTGAGTSQNASASGGSRITQVGGDYTEHDHRYVRGWEYLHGVRVDDHEMDLIEHAFVDPADSAGPGVVARASRALRSQPGQSNVLVLVGEAGTGRRAAALRVLHEAGVSRERIRWLVPDWERPRTEQVPHTSQHGFVLDLKSGPTLSEDFYTGLSDYRKTAEASGAYLIILATPDTWNPGSLTTVYSVPLPRPPAKEIATAHVRRLAPEREDWLTTGPLEGLLAPTARAGDAARLARIIAQAPKDDRQAVAEEFNDWRAHLQRWFEKHAEPDDLRERALLLAAALLERVPARIVLQAADELFSLVGGALPRGGPLAGRDLDKRLDAIDASTVEEEALSLDVDHHGLSEAVLKYVWLQRPQLRQPLLEWASRLSAPGGTAVKYLREIADALVRLSLLPGGSMVQSVAGSWISTGRAAHRELALEVLEAMALHPVTGPGVRKNLYSWAQQKNTSPELAAAIADICAGRLGQTYPRIALTRLRLLAAREDLRDRAAACQAVRKLAANAAQPLLILSEIIQWTSSESDVIRRVGAETFLALTELADGLPLPLLAEQSAAGFETDAAAWEMLVRGWRAALAENATTRKAHEQLDAWLDSASVPDEQVMPLAAAVLRTRLAEPGAAAVLVGSAAQTELGRDRRRAVFGQLLSEQLHAPGAAEQHPLAAAENQALVDTVPPQ
ncbi:hypothetical protein [Streptomyces purpurogeneiscleroticus]|uniref:hypothetical protein n=1 Tax=Streptomyces purpurogeneiscleroticus TaxID=68259 RepID=UPI001CBB870D|nr:hypothetical protein [Streptomyces purpurogeneiscleroticus]MBZ4016267.1 hypothetical protein [Streptomyces purpurogeneiscleroticus]